MVKHRPKLQEKASEGEYQHFSEQFTERILDPRQPWIIQYFLAGGFDEVPAVILAF
ncbi:MAG: hypothetical protein ABSD89_13305 [Halobacteriota archaeon]